MCLVRIFDGGDLKSLVFVKFLRMSNRLAIGGRFEGIFGGSIEGVLTNALTAALENQNVFANAICGILKGENT